MSSLRPAQGRAAHPRLLLILLAALSLLSSVAFVLAPVERTEAVYSWPSAPGDATAVAIPLMLERPADLTARIGCAAARDAEPGTVLLSTTTLEQKPGVAPLPGLRVTAAEDGLQVRSAGSDLDTQPVPASGDCRWELRSTPEATALLLDGEPVAELPGDHRPSVAGVFSEVSDPRGLSVDVTADTVFQTSPTGLKIGLGALALLALAASLALLFLRERTAPAVARTAATDEGTESAPGDGRRGPVRVVVDAAVVAVLAGWTVIGPVTVDDGYIAGIVRSREANGYVGNVYRWFNAPEAPFGWFYELFDAWSAVSTSMVWMRIPSALLGVVTWLLVGRALLPRLGAFTRRPGTYLVAAIAFALWWLPTGLGLRPEAWVAAGLAAVVVLVERGLARERLLPIALALAVASATLAVTPTGAVAFLPVLVALVPILRMARRSPVGTLPACAVASAAVAAGLLLMFADQSLAGVRVATAFRNELPGAVPWWTEIQRWYDLLSTGNQQGSLARRVPVLLGLVALAGLSWQWISGRWPADVARSVAGRLMGTFTLSLVVLLFTPTKWTMHFGAFVPVGAALLVIAVHSFGRARSTADEPAPLLPRLIGVCLVLVVSAVCWAGWNRWAFVSNREVTFNDIPPQFLGVQVTAVFLTLAVVAAGAGAAVLLRARLREDPERDVPAPRWMPTAAMVAVPVMLLTIALPPATFLKAAWERRDTYTPASDVLATVQGRPCGLPEKLFVEPDPRAGLLTPVPASGGDAGGPELDGFVPVDDPSLSPAPTLSMAGQRLPGWSATGHTAASGDGPATLTTDWFRVPDSLREERLPLVVTVAGDRGVGTELLAEFGTLDGDRVTVLGDVPVPEAGGAPAARDARLDASAVPPQAGLVRLVATDRGTAGELPLSVAVPRVPVTEPFSDVVDTETPVLVDWPVAFVFPCQTLAVQAAGLTDVPRWRITPAPGDPAGEIVVAPFVGGPYSAADSLVEATPFPVYLENRSQERLVQLLAWTPRLELAEPRRSGATRTVTGWGG
ncbi:arabinosyltransferase B [Blastococcus aurantiacus]|uniref:Arabinosyltransferase B n=1 Tax=Blastococcus aurantiacus TaxID=1550231 RepID=A0A1G7L087_9ACTN|nr:arabinosyltransferase domain-containing protein [Blastococcus aurantiacus]SDF42756.1 arabinosyltransferase B [Blastococcus aurantiacus]